MTPELTFLVYSILLTFVLILVPATVSILANGALAQAGPRDDLPEPSAFNKRCVRLRNNMLENMVMFTGLVLVAHVAGVSTPMTVLGAQIFFFARVLHAIVYIAGWPLVRPLLWAAGVVGMGMIAIELL